MIDRSENRSQVRGPRGWRLTPSGEGSVEPLKLIGSFPMEWLDHYAIIFLLGNIQRLLTGCQNPHIRAGIEDGFHKLATCAQEVTAVIEKKQ